MPTDSYRSVIGDDSWAQTIRVAEPGAASRRVAMQPLTQSAGPTAARHSRTDMCRSTAIVLIAAGASTLWIGTRARVGSTTELVLLVVGTIGWLWAFSRATRDVAMPRRAVFAATGLLLVVSVATPPTGSRDVWSYVMYGRLEVVHHVDPYTVSPSGVPDDPFLQEVGAGWRTTRSVYGPVFVGVATAGALVGGDSRVRNRMFHQGLGALVVLGAIVACRRRSQDLAPIVLLGLGPPITTVVNSGHNDLLVGGLVFGGVLAAARWRHVLAGLLVAAAALVKLVAVLPAAAVVVWVWRRHGRLHGLLLAGTIAATTAVAYAAVGGTRALSPLLHADPRLSRASTWSGLRLALTPIARLVGADGAPAELVQVAHRAAPVLLAALLLASLRLTDRRSATPAATAAALAFVVAWPYVLPGYAIWALVIAAGAPREWTARAAVAVSAALTLAYVDPPGHHPSGAVLGVLSAAAPMVALVLWIMLEYLERRPAAPPPNASPAVTLESGLSEAMRRRRPALTSPPA